jgi:hypothetical protein
MRQAHPLAWGSNQKNKNNEKEKKEPKKVMTTYCPIRSSDQMDLHCLADPRPVASDLFMILNFLQVLVNILQIN